MSFIFIKIGFLLGKLYKFVWTYFETIMKMSIDPGHCNLRLLKTKCKQIHFFFLILLIYNITYYYYILMLVYYECMVKKKHRFVCSLEYCILFFTTTLTFSTVFVSCRIAIVWIYMLTYILSIFPNAFVFQFIYGFLKRHFYFFIFCKVHLNI